ncbi:MAG: hypothetical protein NEHIOOID_01115 [Holosporales bacterium]
MLVSCPRCAKVYHIAPAELPSPIKMNKKGKGWFLSCQYCFHEWWFQSPQGFTWYEGGEPPAHFGRTIVRKQAKFIDQTNIDYLKNPQSAYSESSTQYQDAQLTQEYTPFHDEGAKVLGRDTHKTERSIFFKPFMAFLIVFNMALIYYVLDGSFFKKKDISALFQRFIPKSQKDLMLLSIGHINHQIIKDATQQTVHIKWELLNSKEQSESFPKMTVKILGFCQKNEIQTSFQSDDLLCILKAWDHEDVTKKTIAPNEIVSINTSASLPLDVDVQKVVIELIS